MLDSGTTFSYLPSAAFKAFSTAVGKAAEAKGLKPSPGSDPQVGSRATCMYVWRMAPHAWASTPAECHTALLPACLPACSHRYGAAATMRLLPLHGRWLSCRARCTHSMYCTFRGCLQYADICWKGAPESIHDLGSVFPAAEFIFGGGTVLHLTPLRYLFMMGTDSFCLGVFDNGASGTLIGGVSVRDVIVKVGRTGVDAGGRSMGAAAAAAARGRACGAGGASRSRPATL